MKVRELIAELQKFDPELDVVTLDPEYGDNVDVEQVIAYDSHERYGSQYPAVVMLKG